MIRFLTILFSLYLTLGSFIPVHAAADVTMHTTTREANSPPNGMMGMVVTNISNIYLIFVTSDNSTIKYVKSTTGGAFWGAETIVMAESVGDIRGMAIWYDQWTEGGTGTKIHVAWNDGRNTLKYKNLDTATDTLSSPVTIGSEGSSLSGDARVTLVKTVNGHLFADTVNGSTPIFFRSIDNGVTWAGRSETGICGNTANLFWFTPSATATDFNCWLYTGSGTAVTKYTYDGAGNTWSNTTGITFVSAANVVATYVQGNVYLAVVDNVSGSNYTLKTWRYSTAIGTMTATGNVFTSVTGYNSNIQSVAIMKSQILDRVFLFYRGSGGNLINSVYSDDEMVTWSTPVRIDSAASNATQLLAGVQDTVGVGGRACVSWLNLSNNISYVNTDGCIAIVSPPPPEHWFIGVRDTAGFSDNIGNLFWVTGTIILLVILFALVGAPAAMIGIIVGLGVVAMIALELLPVSILIGGALLLGLIMVIVVIRKAGATE